MLCRLPPAFAGHFFMNGALAPFFCFVAMWKYFTMGNDCRFYFFRLLRVPDGLCPCPLSFCRRQWLKAVF